MLHLTSLALAALLLVGRTGHPGTGELQSPSLATSRGSAPALARSAAACETIKGTALESYLGEWTVRWQYRLQPEEYQHSIARSTFTSDLANCALVEHFHGTLRDVPYAAITTFVLRDALALQRSRIDSEHGGFVLSEGVMRADTLVFETSRQFGERTMRTKHLFGPVEDGGFSSHFYLSRSLDDPWALVEESFYERPER